MTDGYLSDDDESMWMHQIDDDLKGRNPSCVRSRVCGIYCGGVKKEESNADIVR